MMITCLFVKVIYFVLILDAHVNLTVLSLKTPDVKQLKGSEWVKVIKICNKSRIIHT